MATNMNIAEFVQHRTQQQEFTKLGEPFYSERADSIFVLFDDCPCYFENVDEVLTICRSVAGDRLIGCKLKGVSLLARNVLHILDVEDESSTISLRALLLNAAGPKPVSKHYYYDVSLLVKHIAIPASKFRKAA